MQCFRGKGGDLMIYVEVKDVKCKKCGSKE